MPPPKSPGIGSTAKYAMGHTKKAWNFGREKATKAASYMEAAATRAGALLDIADAMVPTTFHQITVHVQGGPAAHITRIWHLACAACFGRRSAYGMTSVRGQAINATWDISGKSATISLAYTVSGYIAVAAGKSGASLDRQRPADGLELLARGPNQLTIGKGWGEVVSTLGDAGRRIVDGVTGSEGLGAGPGTIVGSIFETADDLLRSVVGPRIGLGESSLIRDALKNTFSDVGSSFSTRVPAADVFLPYAGYLTFLPRDASYRVGAPPQVVITALMYPYRRRVLDHFTGLWRSLSLFGNTLTVADQYLHRPDILKRALVPLGALPDNGRIITTAEKLDPMVQPPKPQVDGLSRSNPLAMIAAALAEPGYLVSPPMTQQRGDQYLWEHAPTFNSVTNGTTNQADVTAPDLTHYPPT